jgi:hypothetical protein
MSILKRVFSWRTLRALLFIGVALVTLLALILAFENWRGKRAWLRYKAEWEAKGEKFDLASFVPPRVPDSENFAMTPFLAPLLDYTQGVRGVVWRDTNALPRVRSITFAGTQGRPPKFANRDKGEKTDLRSWQEYYRSQTNFVISRPGDSPGSDILQALSKYDAVLAELREAAKRPHATFPIHYEETISALVSHLEVLKNIANLSRLHALAALDANQPQAALEDMDLSLRIADAIKGEPLLISQLVRIAMLRITADITWEGIAAGRWNEEHLAHLQTGFSSIDLLSDYERSIRGERALGNTLIERMRAGYEYEGMFKGIARYAPSGLLYQNQCTINRMYQEYFFGVIDLKKRCVDVERIRAMEKLAEVRDRHPYRFLATLLVPALEKTSFRFVQGQTVMDQAVMACALERYRLAKGEYPETLQLLAPQFLREIPHDIISGEPLHYTRSATNKFVLYSIGWDRKDDHGMPAPSGAPSPAEKSGDWVWTPASPN